MTRSTLPALRPILTRLIDLKRVRTPDYGRASLAQQGFVRAWVKLVAGDNLETVALTEAAHALVALELAGIDADILRQAGLSESAVLDLFHTALGRVDAPLAPLLRRRLSDALPLMLERRAGPPTLPFVDRLAAQPRAGATHPTKPRLILEPPESHADHCYSVAVMAVVLGGWSGDASGGVAFLAGLAHHLHNAALPDAGFAGEELLGEHLQPVMKRLTEAALDQLPTSLAHSVREAFELLPAPDGPDAQAFHAADVLDRVLEMVHYDRVARFRTEYALADLELVHAGPLRLFQNEVLAAAGVP